MKAKLRIPIIALAMTLLLTPTVANAAEPSNAYIPNSYEGQLIVIPDENTPMHISYGGYTPAISLNPQMRSSGGPTYHWGANIGWFSGSCYSESWNSDKTKQYPIDEIMASVSVYEDGVHAGDNTDAQYDSYTAKASYSGDALSVVVGREAYGSHRFEHSGYQTMEKESYAN